MAIKDIASVLEMAQGTVRSAIKVAKEAGLKEPVKAWVAQRTAQIEVFYLPSYSPDLNPDERLNTDLKYALGSRGQTRTKDKLKEATKALMDFLEKEPERVRSYFDDPRVKYAASDKCSLPDE